MYVQSVRVIIIFFPMSDWGGSEEDGSEEEGGNDDGPDLLSQLFDAGDKNDERGVR